MSLEYTELRTIKGKFEHITNDNLLYMKNDDKITCYNLVKGTNSSRISERNQIYDTIFLNDKFINLVFDWQFKNKIISIFDQNDNLLIEIPIDQYSTFEILKPISFSTFYCLIVILILYEETCFYLIKLDNLYNINNIGNKIIVNIDRYNYFFHEKLSDIPQGLVFKSEHLNSEFILTEDNKIVLTNSNFHIRRIKSDLLINTSTLDNNNIKFEIIENDKRNEYCHDRKVSPKKILFPFSVTTTTDSKIYFIKKNILFIINLNNLNFNLKIKLKFEKPNFSAISTDTKFIYLIYYDKVKILTDDKNLHNNYRSTILSEMNHIYSLPKDVRIYNDHYQFWINSEVLKKHSGTLKNSLKDCPEKQIFLDNNIDLRILEKILEKVQIDSHDYLKEYFEIH